MTQVMEFLWMNNDLDNMIVDEIVRKDEPTPLILEFNRRAERVDLHLDGATPYDRLDADEVAACAEMMDGTDALSTAMHDFKTMLALTQMMIERGDEHFMLALPLLVDATNDMAKVGRKAYDRMFDKGEAALQEFVQMETPLDNEYSLF